MPAGSIGYFSTNQSGARRDRKIYCRRKDGGRAYATKPDKVAWSRTVYGAGKDLWFDHDHYFSQFEKLNDDCISNLLDESEDWKDAHTWVRLAGYVASRLTRTPDTEFELAKTLSVWGQPNVSVGYIMDMQRTSAAVLRTRWQLISLPEHQLIISDRGFAGFPHPEWDNPALVVPLRPHHAAIIGGGARHRKQLRWQGGRWQIELPTYRQPRAIAEAFNTVLWFGARNECYAATPQLLDAAPDDRSAPPEVRDLADVRPYVLDILGSSLQERIADELLLNSLLTGIRPGDASHAHIWI